MVVRIMKIHHRGAPTGQTLFNHYRAVEVEKKVKGKWKGGGETRLRENSSKIKSTKSSRKSTERELRGNIREDYSSPIRTHIIL